MLAAVSVAPTFELERGSWRFFPPPERGALGALLLEGLIAIRIQAGRTAHIEILGTGDLISPWVRQGDELNLPSAVSSTIVSAGRIALLDRRFALRTARWPEIQAALLQRVVARARRLSLQAAINSLPRIEQRLEATFWALGQRLGRVTPDGITLALPITHSQLSELVGAQRPSVSMALSRLHASGTLCRRGRDQWLLPGEPPAVLISLARQAGLQA